MPVIGISSNCCLDLSLADALEKLSQHTAFVEILSSGNHSLFDYGEAAAGMMRKIVLFERSTFAERF